MFQKVNYSVYQDTGSRNGRGEYQLKIRAMLNKSMATFPTNIYVTNCCDARIVRFIQKEHAVCSASGATTKTGARASQNGSTASLIKTD